MGAKKIHTLKEIEEAIKEPKEDYIEKLSKISDDTKSLILRVPQEIREVMKINKGDRLKFFVTDLHKKSPKLKITLIKENVR